jgi:outer membrane protein OmpA-like peptidoglycan-associated protein
MIMLARAGMAQNELEKLDQLSSSADDQNPILSPDGNTMYFVRKNHPANTGGTSDPGDIWVSERQMDGSWGDPANLKALNNERFNGIIGFADGGNQVYLHGHYLDDDKKPTSQGISVSNRQGSNWSEPRAVKIPYFYNKSDHMSGSLHMSGQVMLLSLQSYDSRGAEDLYVLFKKADGSWSEPNNLGKDINTPYQEMTPFLAADGKTLYFASNGYETFGSRDIFSSVRLDDSWESWSNPKNLGARVNTEGTELYYYLPPGSDYAFLSSTQNSEGLGDINRLRINPEEEQIEEEPIALSPELNPVVTTESEEDPAPINIITPLPEEEEASTEMVSIQGQVLNERSQEPVAASVIFLGLKEQDSVLVNTTEDGNYSLSLSADNDYQLIVEGEGYIRKRNTILLSQQAPIDNSDVVVRNFALTPIEVGITVNLEDVLFDRGTAEMLSGSTETLDEVALFLRKNPEIEIEVAGHTDNRGRPDLNLILSQERAEAVKRYLVEQGIAAGRIQEKGYGGTKPIASNAIEEERRKNRRVEFTIIKK